MKKIDKAYTIRHIVRYANNKQKYDYRKNLYDYCVKVFRHRLEANNIPVDLQAPGEEQYISFWSQFCDRVEPYTYRFFYHFLGENPHIVPEDIANIYIESLLNPEEYRKYYSDKNTYNKYLLPQESIPKTYLCRISGGGLQSNGKYFNFHQSETEIAEMIGENVEAVVLKPSNNSHSGAGVMLFERVNDCYMHDGIRLSGEYLKSYASDLVVQEVIKQHGYLRQFCTSSCNTLRIMTYRSIKDESVCVFGAVLRIGHEGSFVDNLFAGGGFVTINVDNGELGKCVYDEFGRSANSINDIDFSQKTYVLPFWQIAKQFAGSIASQTPHMRLLAQDIIIDQNNHPRLIEFNVGDFNWSFTMYGKRIPFGNRFDEVIEYCLKNKYKIDN